MRPAHWLTGLLLILLGFALAALVDLDAVATALRRVPIAYVATGLLLVQVQIVLSAWRWRFTAARLGQQMTWGRAIGEYYVATVVNQLLPGGAAGDVLRAYRLRSGETGSLKRAAKSVVFERLSGQMSFFAFFFAGLFFWPMLPGHLLLRTHTLLMIGLAILCAVAIVYVAGRYFKNLGSELRRVFVNDGAWAVQAGLSFSVMLSYAGQFMLAGSAVGAPLPYAAAVTIVPLCLLAMLIPTGLGGWGTREASAAALWPLAGLASADGVAASLLYGALTLAGSMPGLLILMVSKIRRHTSTSA